MDWLAPVRELFEFVLPFLDQVPVIRAMLGIALVFFLPGFAWSFIFFKQLKALERMTISVALSVVFVTLSLLFATRLSGFRLSGLSAALVIIVVTILPVIAYYLNRLFRSKKGKAA